MIRDLGIQLQHVWLDQKQKHPLFHYRETIFHGLGCLASIDFAHSQISVMQLH